MSDYAERRIQEALKLSKGNELKARKTVLAWCMEDERLLHDLVKQHLNGIVAYNIERVASGRSDKAKSLEPLTKKIKKNKEEKFGMEILRAVVDDHAPVFGFEDQPPSKRRASDDHISAIKKIANTRAKSKKDQKN